MVNDVSLQHMYSIKTILFASIGIFTLTTCNQTADEKKPEAQDNIPIFYGKITYTSSFISDDSTIMQTIGTFTPEKTEVYFAQDKFRLIEYGGASHGNILLFLKRQEAWQIDTSMHIAYLCEFSDFDNPGEDLMDMMPDHFAPTLEITNETESIMGIDCKKYKVIRSGFIPSGDQAEIWVTDQFKFPPSRFDFLSEVNSVIVPFPLYIGYSSGAIMRMKLTNKNYSASFEITEMDKAISDQSIFSIPEGYQKK